MCYISYFIFISVNYLGKYYKQAIANELKKFNYIFLLVHFSVKWRKIRLKCIWYPITQFVISVVYVNDAIQQSACLSNHISTYHRLSLTVIWRLEVEHRSAWKGGPEAHTKTGPGKQDRFILDYATQRSRQYVSLICQMYEVKFLQCF